MFASSSSRRIIAVRIFTHTRFASLSIDRLLQFWLVLHIWQWPCLLLSSVKVALFEYSWVRWTFQHTKITLVRLSSLAPRIIVITHVLYNLQRLYLFCCLSNGVIGELCCRFLLAEGVRSLFVSSWLINTFPKLFLRILSLPRLACFW